MECPVQRSMKELRTRSNIWAQRDVYRSTKYLYDGRENYDAIDLMNLVERYSMAADDNFSRDLRQKFVRNFDDDEYYQLDYGGFKRYLKDYYRHLDRLFFFGLLNEEVRKPASGKYEPLVTLEVRGVAPASRSGRTTRTTLGEFRYDEHKIYIFTSGGYESWNLPKVITTLAHEMAHAFLGIFRTEGKDEPKRWVKLDDGHGQMFWELVHFIYQKLYDWTGVSFFDREACAAHYRLELAQLSR
ncbi:hypothetical protein F5Y15DRAFT_417526 [Xylariaceae sp. FL0016]|nr:hypothetical protein F5Y15DRAFT_417526 [Xylariaceae sp. FL0016]